MCDRSKQTSWTMTKSTLTILALLALSPAAYASELSPAWQNSFDYGSRGNSAIVRTGPNTFDRLVRDQGQCSKGEQLMPAWTASTSSGHFLGYTCEAVYD